MRQQYISKQYSERNSGTGGGDFQGEATVQGKGGRITEKVGA